MEIEFRGIDMGVKFMRKFFPYYISGIKNAAKVRGAIVLEENPDVIIKILKSLLVQV